MTHLSRRRLALCATITAGAVLIAMPLAAQQAGRHPDRRYIDESMAPTSRIQIGARRTPPPATLGERPLASIGVESGADDLMFTEISGVLALENGTIAIADRRTQNVRLFDSTGRFLQRIGRPGQGPGEFRAPHLLFEIRRNEFWVGDMQRRLSVFTPYAAEYRHARSIPVDFGVRSLCRIGEAIVANAIGMGDPNIVRIIDSTGRSVRAFGKIYASPSAILNYQFSEGRVACDENRGLIVFASHAAIGELRAYRPDGQMAWRTVIEGTKSNVVTETAGGGYEVSGSGQGVHALLSLNSAPGCGIILQYGHRSQSQIAARDPGEVVTLFADPASGARTISTAAWPRIASVRGGRAYVVLEDPAPRVEVRELVCRRIPTSPAPPGSH